MYPQHALSKLFPPMAEHEVRELALDIAEFGLRQSIVLYQGEILDGWHRGLACELAGKEPRYVSYTGDKPAAYVKSLNWHRRNMTQGQKALVAVELDKWAGVGRPKASTEDRLTTTEMAAGAGVSPRSIAQAKVVAARGTEAVKAAVRDGTLALDPAERIARLPQQDQAAAVESGLSEEPAPDLAAELERAGNEIRQLQTQVAALSKSDLAREILSWQEKFFAMEGRLTQEINTCHEAKRQATYASGLLTKIRGVLGVERDRDILLKLATKPQ